MLVRVQEPETPMQKVLQSRWIIQPKQDTQLEVVLQASALDTYHRSLDFEVSCMLLLLHTAWCILPDQRAFDSLSCCLTMLVQIFSGTLISG